MSDSTRTIMANQHSSLNDINVKIESLSIKIDFLVEKYELLRAKVLKLKQNYNVDDDGLDKLEKTLKEFDQVIAQHQQSLEIYQQLKEQCSQDVYYQDHNQSDHTRELDHQPMAIKGF